VIAQFGDNLGHIGAFLADGAINGDDSRFFLVDDCINGDGCFAGHPVTQNQFALTAPDWNERVNDFNAGLQGHYYRRAIHNRRRWSFHRIAQDCIDLTQAVKRTSQRVDNSSQKRVSHWHIQNALGAVHFRSHLQVFTGIQKNHADFRRVYIKNKTHIVSCKANQFLCTDVRQTADSGNIASDKLHRANFILPQLRILFVQNLFHGIKRIIQESF